MMSGRQSEVTSAAGPSGVRASGVDGARLQPLTPHRDVRGTLIALERDHELPFHIQRVFYIYDVPEDQSRANHAISAHMLLVPVNGSLVVEIDNGRQSGSFELNSREIGLYVEPGVLTRLTRFAPQTILLVASSERYASTEYSDRPFFYNSDKAEQSKAR